MVTPLEQAAPGLAVRVGGVGWGRAGRAPRLARALPIGWLSVTSVEHGSRSCGRLTHTLGEVIHIVIAGGSNPSSPTNDGTLVCLTLRLVLILDAGLTQFNPVSGRRLHDLAVLDQVLAVVHAAREEYLITAVRHGEVLAATDVDRVL